MKLESIIKHYLHILNKEYEQGFNSFVFENIFKTDKFKVILRKKPSKLFLIYTTEYDPALHDPIEAPKPNEFFNDDNFIYTQENYAPPIGDFWYAAILCAEQENLNLFKLVFNMKDKEITDLTTMLEKIEQHIGDNNV